jgi:glycosyltransferase involved in cell wall biosynthesis
MKHILVFCEFITRDEIGGSGRVIEQYVDGLKNKGFKITIFTLLRKKGLQRYEKINENVFVIRYGYFYSLNIFFAFLTVIDGIFKFIKFFLTTKFDLIIINQPYVGSVVYTSLIGWFVPKIYFFHSPWCEEYLIDKKKKGVGYYLRKIIEKKVISFCNKIVCYSEFMKNKIVSIHRIKKNIKVLHVGIDTNRFYPAENKIEVRKKLGLPENKFIIFTARRLVPRMGLENLIEAIKMLKKEFDNIFLVIVGSGWLEDKLKVLAKKLEVSDYIKFVGKVSNPNVLLLYYQSADIFVLPTKLLEGFGMVILEAMSCGVPVVSTPVGGPVEVLKNFDEHLLCNGTEPYDIYERIKYFLLNKNELQKIAGKCREFVIKNYSKEIFIEEFKKEILKIL